MSLEGATTRCEAQYGVVKRISKGEDCSIQSSPYFGFKYILKDMLSALVLPTCVS